LLATQGCIGPSSSAQIPDATPHIRPSQRRRRSCIGPAICGRSQALEKPRTTIAVGGKSLLQGRASQIVLGVNPKTMAGIRVLTGFALLLDALVGRIEWRLMSGSRGG